MNDMLWMNLKIEGNLFVHNTSSPKVCYVQDLEGNLILKVLLTLVSLF
jgi:hypothetical protein